MTFLLCLFFQQSLAFLCAMQHTYAPERSGLPDASERCFVAEWFSTWSRRRMVLFTGLAWLFCTVLVHARVEPSVQSVAAIRLSDLPAEGQHTYRLIHAGGPFRYDKDGSVFGNRERILPRQPRGYYREYTVRTPGERDRGARRIVCGGELPRQPTACYYTADHYASFRMIVDTPH
jgi:ribonuclease T1